MPLRYVHALMCFLSCLSITATGGLLGLTIIQMVLPVIETRNVTKAIDEAACPVPDAPIYRSDDSAHVDLVIIIEKFIAI